MVRSMGFQFRDKSSADRTISNIFTEPTCRDGVWKYNRSNHPSLSDDIIYEQGWEYVMYSTHRWMSVLQ